MRAVITPACGKGQTKMPRILIKVIAALAIAAVGTSAVLLLINILLFFKLKSMFRYGTPPADNRG